MSNEFQEEWLTAYLDGELDDQQLQIVRRRLDEDPSVSRMLEELKRVRRLVENLPLWDGPDLQFAPDASLIATAADTKPELPSSALLTETVKPSASARLPRRSVWTAPLALAATLLLALGLMWFKFSEDSWQNEIAMKSPSNESESIGQEQMSLDAIESGQSERVERDSTSLLLDLAAPSAQVQMQQNPTTELGKNLVAEETRVIESTGLPGMAQTERVLGPIVNAPSLAKPTNLPTPARSDNLSLPPAAMSSGPADSLKIGSPPPMPETSAADPSAVSAVAKDVAVERAETMPKQLAGQVRGDIQLDLNSKLSELDQSFLVAHTNEWRANEIADAVRRATGLLQGATMSRQSPSELATNAKEMELSNDRLKNAERNLRQLSRNDTAGGSSASAAQPFVAIERDYPVAIVTLPTSADGPDAVFSKLVADQSLIQIPSTQSKQQADEEPVVESSKKKSGRWTAAAMILLVTRRQAEQVFESLSAQSAARSAGWKAAPIWLVPVAANRSAGDMNLASEKVIVILNLPR